MNIRLIAAALACAAPAWAALADERDRIATERAAANARLAEQQRECSTRFLVAPCLEEARRAHRDTTSRLRQEQLLLDETSRRESAAARRKATAERVDAQQRRASEAASEPPGVRVRRAPEPPLPPTSAGIAPLPRPPVISASQAEQNAQKFQARTRAADAHRESVERRNAERAAQGKAAKPLPTPLAASSGR